MNTTRCLAAVSLAIAALGASSAQADDIHCPPALGAVTVDGNVLVTGRCELSGTRVDGNVHVYTGGTLVARDAHIGGNVQTDRAFEIDIADSHIGGSVQLDELVGDFSSVVNSEVEGSIQLNANRSQLQIDGNWVGADIQAFSNSGGVDVFGNTVDGNLQCKSNRPVPTGGGNTVHGNREDQCARLEPAATQSAMLRAPSSVAMAAGTGTVVAATETTTAGGGGSTGWLTVLSCAALVLLKLRSAPARGRLR